MRRFAVIGCALVASSACGGGNLAQQVAQPRATTANEAMNEPTEEGTSCLAVGARDTPLVVDMRAMDRADLEEAMHAGVGVVAYDCHKIRLLTDCRIPGDYGFVAVSLKKEAVQLATADEVQANLPFSAALLIKAGYGRKSSLDLATVMIGKRTTSVRQASVTEAVGSCDGATHFIRGAYLGAFAMKTGTIGKVESAATLFGAGGTAHSDSERNVDDRDGDPGKCEQVSLDTKVPPAECSALLRLELVALSHDKTTSPAASAPPGAEPAATCPEGTYPSNGVCTKDASKPHVCAETDEADCRAQCDKGDADSCANLGVLKMQGGQDAAGAVALFQKACAAGVGRGCNGLGVAAAKGVGASVDFGEAMKQYQHACELGYMRACFNVGYAYADGQGVPADPAKAAPFYQRACDGGVGRACMNLGVAMMSGSGVPKDPATAAKLLERGCNGDEAQACANLATAYGRGDGVAPDAAKAATFQHRACDKGYAPACH